MAEKDKAPKGAKPQAQQAGGDAKAKAPKGAKAGDKGKAAAAATPAKPRPKDYKPRMKVLYEKVVREAVKNMVARGMKDLTGSPDAVGAWRLFFEHGDVVGVKVNPVGFPHAISNHELVHEVVSGLKSAGVEASDIIVFDRYRAQFIKAGYLKNLPEDRALCRTGAGCIPPREDRAEEGRSGHRVAPKEAATQR